MDRSGFLFPARSSLSVPHSSPHILAILVLASIMGLSGCAGEEPAKVLAPGSETPVDDADDPGDESSIHQFYQSSLERALSPDESGIPDLVRGNHEFAVDLYARLREGEGNFLFSPLSLRMAFAMVYAGARGETAEQMAEVLHYDHREAVHTAFNALDLVLQSRNRPADGEFSETELTIANAFWGRIGLPFKPEYLDLLTVHYGSGVHGLDFERATEESRVIINDWVAEETRDRIRDLLPAGSVSPLTAAVLTNTLYFRAPWASPFIEEFTGPGIFHLIDGATTTVAMMQGDSYGGYAEGDGYEAVELLYHGFQLGMIIVVPDAGEFEAFESGLSFDLFDEIISRLGSSWRELYMTLPRFTFESTFRLAQVFRAMGMRLPFMNCFPVPCADFGGIIDSSVMNLYIDDVFHKTFIAVDEKGTEAAAATGIVMNPTTGPHYPTVFTVDRPFIFAIRDVETGAILFLGRVLNPDAG